MPNISRKKKLDTLFIIFLFNIFKLKEVLQLLSQCIVMYGDIVLDLSIEIVNPALAACRRTQPSNSSRSLHLSIVVKNDPVFTSIT